MYVVREGGGYIYAKAFMWEVCEDVSGTSRYITNLLGYFANYFIKFFNVRFGERDGVVCISYAMFNYGVEDIDFLFEASR